MFKNALQSPDSIATHASMNCILHSSNNLLQTFRACFNLKYNFMSQIGINLECQYYIAMYPFKNIIYSLWISHYAPQSHSAGGLLGGCISILTHWNWINVLLKEIFVFILCVCVLPISMSVYKFHTVSEEVRIGRQIH